MLSFGTIDSMVEKHSRTAGILRAGAFEIDLGTCELRKDGQRVPLQEQPFQVLALLLQRPGKLVTREEILEKLWPASGIVNPGRSLDIAIHRLQQALEDASGKAGYLETIPERGYRFLAKVSAESPAQPGIERKPGGARALLLQRGIYRSRRARVGLGVALAAGLAVAAYGIIKMFPKPPQPPERVKLAVLPFNNLSGKPEDEHLSDGITDELITRLGRVRPERLGVIAATSVWPLKHTQESVKDVGGKLGVDYLVEGSVFHEGDEIRISAKLIQVSDATQLWTDSYDRHYADLLSVEGDVAGSVVNSLALKLVPAERARLVAPDSKNPQAHEDYLEGRYYWNKRTAEGFKKSIEYYNLAIGIDPNFAAAYAGLADTYDAIGFYSLAPPGDSYGKAREAAQRALQIDDSLAEAHAALAEVLMHNDYDWKRAGEEFQRAIKLNQNYEVAHDGYSIYLALTGRQDEGLAQIQRAHDLNPLYLVVGVNWALQYFYARKYDEAIARCKKTLELEPNFALGHFWLGRAYEAKGMYAQAIEEFQRTNQLEPENPLFLALLGSAYGASGQTAEAQRIIEQLKGASLKHYISPVMISLIYTSMDDRNEALDWAEKAYAERAPMLTRMKMDPLVDRLRSEPRFQALLRRVGPPA
jgi:TolB-like protein/DNA-binding winged helix-turn-helix (wHTH) protein/Tfp pilus assembly protein PilF